MSGRFKVLITTKLFGIISDEPVKMLEEAGCEIVRSPLKHPIPPGGLATIIGGIDALIVGNDIVDRAAVDAADRLKVICMHGTGMDAIDVEYARSKGIVVTNLPGGNASAVAEFALCLMLDLSRRATLADRQMRGGHWRKNLGDEIVGKTLGIIGLGSAGKLLAEKARALGMEVVAFTRTKDEEFASRLSLRYLPLEELLSCSDYVSVHVSLSKDTYHMIDGPALMRMKNGAYLVNTSRGGIVDEGALYNALKEGYLAGAALDVFEKEPADPASPLFSLDNCILTPHIAGQSKEAQLRNNLSAARKVLDVLLQDKEAKPYNT